MKPRTRKAAVTDAALWLGGGHGSKAPSISRRMLDSEDAHVRSRNRRALVDRGGIGLLGEGDEGAAQDQGDADDLGWPAKQCPWRRRGSQGLHAGPRKGVVGQGESGGGARQFAKHPRVLQLQSVTRAVTEAGVGVQLSLATGAKAASTGSMVDVASSSRPLPASKQLKQCGSAFASPHGPRAQSSSTMRPDIPKVRHSHDARVPHSINRDRAEPCLSPLAYFHHPRRPSAIFPETMASSWAHTGIAPLLERMKSQDSDFRFMALNDLNAELSKDSYIQMDESTENNVVRKVLDLMKDTNTEVKNMVVRSLAILVPRLREKSLQLVVDTLIDYISSDNDELRDIAALALKTVTAQMPTRSSYATAALNKLAPKLLNHVADAAASQELLIDSLDILAELIAKFASSVTTTVALQNAILKAVVPAMRHTRPAVRKRSLTVLGALGSCATSDIFTQLSVQLSADLAAQSSLDTRKTAVQLIGIFARTCPRRLGRRLPEFMPAVLETAQIVDDDELRELSLQSIELILLRCPAEVTPFVNASIELATTLVKHDPNYAGFDEDEEMRDADDTLDDDDEDEDDDYLDEDYSDDDDMASAKVLNAALTSRPELLAHNVGAVAPILVSRFSEREESVRLEILDTFLALLKQMQLYGGGPQATEVIGAATTSSANQAAAIAAAGVLKRKRHEMDADDLEGSPRSQLVALVPAIAKALNREIVSKSIPTRHKSFVVLRELVVVLHGGLDAQIGSILAQTEKSLKGAESAPSGGSNLKADILGFFRVLFLTHQPKSFEDQLPQLVPVLAASIEDKLHRSCIEAFLTCSQLVSVLRPLGATATAPGATAARPGQYKPYLLHIYAATVARLNRLDSDQEIKERGIACLGVLLAHGGDNLEEKHAECFDLLSNRLTSEVTRFVTVKVIAQIASSPVCKGAAFDAFLRSAIAEVATLLRKSDRQLRLAAFDCLAAALSRPSNELSTESSNAILAEVQPLINSDMDMNLLPHVLRSINLILLSDPATRESVRASVLPQIYTVLRLPIAQGPAMDALLEFFRLLVGAQPESATEIVDELLAALDAAKGSVSGTHIYSTVSRCIGASCTVSAPASSIVADKATTTLQGGSAKDSEVYFALLLLGELGRFNDFSTRAGLLERVLAFYAADSEEVKMAAAFAVGNMAAGALGAFLPVIVGHIRGQADDKASAHRFLSLHALKELITHGSAEQLSVVAEEVWPVLFDASETKEEGARSIGAECLARLALSEPTKFLPLLQERLRSPSVSVRATVLAAVRFTLSTESSAAYDELLAPCLVDFLMLLADPELEVRRNATFALNSAAHNKPYLIRDHLATVVPLLYAETHVRTELLRKVAMGPFQIVTDDGLDLRKNAYETMYQLLDSLWSRLDMAAYIDRVVAGLADSDDGIKTLCYLMVIKLVELGSPVVRSVLAGRLEEIADPVGATLRSKLKETATKQEIEKQGELQRFIYRMLVVVTRAMDAVVGPVATPKFSALVQEARSAPAQHGNTTSAPGALWRETEAALATASAP
ncbi:cullin-associated nedd8-dissociated protein 1 [Moesziomyces aphidis]|uniref:Cullin-associated nedd8-dissociated protein 1 n=1 Tax=Moesziomyces aphidis TaxID=84754 RepID=W3VK45_MOEAP|nr:cullin-associated nedd8-dissociated protein 1 [Moesziomyces aphidis]